MRGQNDIQRAYLSRIATRLPHRQRQGRGVHYRLGRRQVRTPQAGPQVLKFQQPAEDFPEAETRALYLGLQKQFPRRF